METLTVGPRPVIRAPLVVSVSMVTASAAALPGEPLYGVKRAAEEAQLSLATDDEQRRRRPGRH